METFRTWTAGRVRPAYGTVRAIKPRFGDDGTGTDCAINPGFGDGGTGTDCAIKPGFPDGGGITVAHPKP